MRARTLGGPLDGDGVELVGGGLGDAGGQLVCLVDDDGVVLRQHRHAVDGVDGKQGVVGDDEVGVLGVLTGLLGEALTRATSTDWATLIADRICTPLRLTDTDSTPRPGQDRGAK